MRYTLFFTSSLFPAPCSRLDAARSWGKPRQSLMGGTPFGGAASPRPRCLPKTALHRCSLFPVPCSLKKLILYLIKYPIAIVVKVIGLPEQQQRS
ncbi:MAG: hypothetical protein F6J90_11925 [Moorea sp. SIOASIH]|uniref:hypothetical protein n=1 Tax=Moorena sp. SIOASIH TaxID=2607817 RepID=UPI0013BA76EA|nr:hypothetical protein [Moorena sp. SIOASIH]NEO36980.1 hypothetical protein [Moorena sp. SIOASIH]